MWLAGARRSWKDATRGGAKLSADAAATEMPEPSEVGLWGCPACDREQLSAHMSRE